MHPLIEKLLRKRGIKDVTELTPDERATFAGWQSKLSGEMTVTKIADYCRGQLESIERQWMDMNNSTEKNQRLIIQHTTYKALLSVISGPALEREGAEKHLESLLT